MKNTGKKALSLFLAVCLVLSLAPAVFADEATVTDADGLKNALSVGGTITLGKDINVNEALTVSKGTTLDLNGHTLAVNHNGMQNYAVLVNAALTIRDGVGSGKITSSTANTLFLDYDEGAKTNSLTLESGTVENTCRKMGDTAIVAVGTTNSTVTITGGTVRSENGSAMFAQSAVLISGGFFQGEVYLAMQEYNDTEHQTITGGHFDRLPGGWYDFYGKKDEVVANPDAATKSAYPYAVQEIPANERVTVSYVFPQSPSLSKAQDYFRKRTEIVMPDAPDYEDHSFIAWSVNGTAISFPYQLGDEAEVTFHAIYAKVNPAPEGFAWEKKPLTDLYVGGVAMMEGGQPAGQLPYTIMSGTGTATLAYNDTGSVYTLTLDAYVYTGPGYAWNWNSNTFNSGIFAKGDLAIVIHSDSSIKATATSADGAVGIAVTGGGLAIASNTSPSPKLTVQGVSSPGSQMSAGVYTDGNLAVRNCKLDTSAANGKSAYGIVAHGSSSEETRNVYVIGADVTAAAAASDYGLGIVASGDVTVQNTSEVTAKATGAKFSYGAQCENLTIDGGYMVCIANGEDAESENCRGVYADGEIAVMSGLLSALAGKAATYHSYGVYACDGLTVGSRGSVFGISKGTTGYNDSVGVLADDITVGAGAELYGLGGDVTDGDSFGVYAWGDITVLADDEDYGELYGVGGEAMAEGDSAGVRAAEITVEDGAELRAIGGKVTDGDSYGVYAWGKLTAYGSGADNDDDYDDEDYDEYTGYGAVDARGGDTTGYGDSCGLYLWKGMAVSDDGAVYAYGGNAAPTCSDSYGIYSKGDVTIAGDSQVEAIGGSQAETSVGVYAEPDTRDDENQQISYPTLHIKNGGQLKAAGGDAAYRSFGVLIDGGMLMMDKEVDTNAELRLDATGGDVTNGWSYGVCVIAGENDPTAISLSGGALVLAAGGQANDNEEHGNSIGVCSLGDVKLSNAELHADGEDGSDFTIGLYLYGENRKLTLENNAEVYARAYEATGGSAGVYFDDMEDPGSVSVAENCVLSAYAGEAALSVAIGNVGMLATGGTIVAIAEGDNGSGILMNNNSVDTPAINVAAGQLGASGKTAAIGAVSGSESPIGDVTLTAPYIEYSIDYSGEPIETVQPEGAALTANGTQKHIMAFASGTLYSVSVTDITETISYGKPIAFTAKPGPASVVKVVDEYWTCGNTVISRNDENPSVPGAGTWRYTLVLAPVEGFTFVAVGDGVGVIYKDEYYEFYPANDGKLVLTTTGDETFIQDVTLTEPYVPPYGGGTTTYTPTITDSAHGKVTADPKAAAAGDTVKLTATPDAGYELDTLTVKDANGKDVALTKNTDGTYSYVQPAGKVTVTATFKESKAEAVRPFTDVKQGDWFYNAVYHCFDKGYFKGVSETKFDPQGTMTRAMFATVLYRMAGEPTVTGENKFADVKGGQWYTDAILWATQAGIVDGYGDGNFGVDDPITREQMVTMLYRYAQSKGQGFQGLWSFKLDFPDAGDVSDWALEAMSWMVMNGVIKGKDGKLAPGATATRAEVAQLIMNFDGLAG